MYGLTDVIQEIKNDVVMLKADNKSLLNMIRILINNPQKYQIQKITEWMERYHPNKD
jgi:hypothetical protein